MVVQGIGNRGEFSSSLLYGVGPWLLVPAELCAERCVQAQENLTANKYLVIKDCLRICAQLIPHESSQHCRAEKNE